MIAVRSPKVALVEAVALLASLVTLGNSTTTGPSVLLLRPSQPFQPVESFGNYLAPFLLILWVGLELVNVAVPDRQICLLPFSDRFRGREHAGVQKFSELAVFMSAQVFGQTGDDFEIGHHDVRFVLVSLHRHV